MCETSGKEYTQDIGPLFGMLKVTSTARWSMVGWNKFLNASYLNKCTSQTKLSKLANYVLKQSESWDKNPGLAPQAVVVCGCKTATTNGQSCILFCPEDSGTVKPLCKNVDIKNILIIVTLTVLKKLLTCTHRLHTFEIQQHWHLHICNLVGALPIIILKANHTPGPFRFLYVNRCSKGASSIARAP